MKKLYVLSFALLFGASTQAQIIDFESYSLASESFDNDAGASEFVLSNGADIHFYNDYNPGGWFTGFAISNTTDVTTPGLPNQYSAWTGGGADGSTVYAIRYGGGAITTPAANVSFDSIKITNTTYAALSMRDGDAIAKQFGSSTNAAGDDDGTNGEDYLRMWIIGTSADGMTSDSIEFYLADYRFSDPTQDYIVDEWVNIDFSSFTFDVNSIDFRLESTDNHPQWGMNTPNYFAIDDVAFSIASGIPTEELSNVQTYPPLCQIT